MKVCKKEKTECRFCSEPAKLTAQSFLNSKKRLIFACVFLSAVLPCISQSSQNSAENSTQRTITPPTPPSVPTVSLPVLGEGFYAPGRSDFYTGNTQTSKNSFKSPQTEEKTVQTAENPQKQSEIPSTVTSQTGNLLLNPLLSGGNTDILTASDLSMLSSLGLSGNISSLLGGNLNQTALQTQKIYESEKNTALLQQVLSELTQLKEKINEKNTSAQQTAGNSADSLPAKNSQATETALTADIPQSAKKILRFNVNGYEILPTLKTVYFSDEDDDGTFLLTGDSKYIQNNAVYAETFHILFKARGSENSSLSYDAVISLSQSAENPSSPLYVLQKKEGLSALRVGNFVSMRANDGTLSVDLLLSMN